MDLQRDLYQQALVLPQTGVMAITTSTANEIGSSSVSTLAAAPNRMMAINRIGVAFRPTLLFVTAFALNATPHEAVHAATAYMLGFSSTL
jgi:hypothetical protein